MVQIITDSSCEISKEDQARMNITVLPHIVRFGDRSFKDDIDITRNEFYEMLEKAQELPTTSQINPAEFEEVFQKVTNDGDDVVAILLSSEVSGTFQSATIAAEMVCPEKIYLVDSNTGSFGLPLLINEAVKLRDAGLSPNEIVEKIQGLTKRIKMYAVIDTLKYLKMGGRLSSTSALIGTLLGIRPILEINNAKIVPVDKVRNIKTGLRKMKEYLDKEPADFKYGFSFGHANAKERLDNCIAYFKPFLDTDNIMIGNIGSSVGAHTGPGVIGISYIKKE